MCTLRNKSILHGVTAVCVFAFAPLAFGLTGTANCSALESRPVPKYSVDRRSYGEGKVLILHISTAQENAEGLPLEKLSCDLESKFSRESKIDAYIYDDKESSRSLAVGFEDQRNHGKFLWHLRAHYHLDRDRGEQTLLYLVPVQNRKDALLEIERVVVSIPISPR